MNEVTHTRYAVVLRTEMGTLVHITYARDPFAAKRFAELEFENTSMEIIGVFEDTGV